MPLALSLQHFCSDYSSETCQEFNYVFFFINLLVSFGGFIKQQQLPWGVGGDAGESLCRGFVAPLFSFRAIHSNAQMLICCINIEVNYFLLV